MVQVVSNLLHNATKYSPANKTVNVSLRRDGSGDGSSGDFAVIEVQDSGRGIAPEDLPSIFDHFYQANRPAGEDSGLGLGLFIARSIVLEQSGTISAKSTVGKGSTFTVRLPLKA